MAAKKKPMAKKSSKSTTTKDDSSQYNETMRQLASNNLPGSSYVKRWETRKNDSNNLKNKNAPWWYNRQSLGDLGYERAETRIVHPRYIYGANPKTLPENRFFNKKKKQR